MDDLGSGAVLMASAIQQLLLAGGAFSFAPVIAADTADYNLTTLLTAAGWNGVSPVNAIVTVNSGVALYASSTSTYGFTMGGTFPTGSYIKLVNQGTIYGAGGVGGNGGMYDLFGAIYGEPTQTQTAGGDGGTAINATGPISIDNTGGTIAGGGGGGGGGGAASDNHYFQHFWGAAGGGGGGGRGRVGGALGYTASGPHSTGGANGTAGSSGAAGTGGAGATNLEATCSSGAGGNGGGLGAAGSTSGAGGGGTLVNQGGAAGGAAGKYAVGNANVTWIANGTRLGGVS